GVTIDYEWYGPAQPDAVDQVNSIETAVGQGYDLIAVDVNQADTTAKAIDTAVDAGVKVATFGTVDVPDCKRSFFVGNDDPYGDGEALAKAVCEKMGGKGQIALLGGTMGAESHEQRLQAFKDVIATYP
ncbi:sugar ABC transporter substrate-binding protein, partial [Porphyromonas gingivalis]|uniref:substrate-binding domain-containing protein n=2 Tax=Bacteria TaxID=2 RepID=UPI0010EABB75